MIGSIFSAGLAFAGNNYSDKTTNNSLADTIPPKENPVPDTSHLPTDTLPNAPVPDTSHL